MEWVNQILEQYLHVYCLYQQGNWVHCPLNATLGCDCAETLHHLCIKCPQFVEYCHSTLQDIHQITLGLVDSIPMVHCEMVMNAISTLLVDDDSHFTWPLGHTSGN